MTLRAIDCDARLPSSGVMANKFDIETSDMLVASLRFGAITKRKKLSRTEHKQSIPLLVIRLHSPKLSMNRPAGRAKNNRLVAEIALAQGASSASSTVNHDILAPENGGRIFIINRLDLLRAAGLLGTKRRGECASRS